MAFDSVPWFVEGGAQHSADVARLLAHIATGGKEGILATEDMRVMPLTTPGASVRVMPGACTIINRALGGDKQSYVGRSSTETELAVPASGSGGPRTHLVIARVENPYISGEPWGPPGDVEDGPYIFPRLIPDVPIATRSVHELNLGFSAITLARITVPTNTATITGSMVTDLRGVTGGGTGGPQPPDDGGDDDNDEEDPVVVCPPGPGDDGDNNNGDPCTNTNTVYFNWPANAVTTVKIPKWATHADVDIVIPSVKIRSGSLGGFLRLQIAGVAQSQQSFKCDWPGNTCRQDLRLQYTDLPIPTNIRGTKQQFRLQAQVNVGFLLGLLLCTPSTRVCFKIKFKCKAT